MERYIHPSTEVQACCHRLLQHLGYKLTLLEFWVSVSVLDDERQMWISLPKTDVRSASIAVQSMNLDKVDPYLTGPKGPIHSKVYQARSDIRAIVQVHSMALESFTLNKSTPNTRVLEQAHLITGYPVYVDFHASPGDFIDAIGSVFMQSQDVKCALITGHGALCVGKTLREALLVFETLDFVARAILRSTRLGAPLTLTDEQLSQHQYLASATTFEEDIFAYRVITSLEKMLRQSIITCVRKCLDQGLMSSTAGSVSVRLSDNLVLITPTRVDRSDMNIQDILLIQKELTRKTFTIIHWVKERKDLVPSRTLKSHFSIYERHPWIQCIISSHPLNVAALCIVGSGLETRFLSPYSSLARVVPLTYDDCLDSERITAAFDETSEGPAGSVLIANDGSITIGNSVENALENLEMLESACSIAIDAYSLASTSYIIREKQQQ